MIFLLFVSESLGDGRFVVTSTQDEQDRVLSESELRALHAKEFVVGVSDDIVVYPTVYDYQEAISVQSRLFGPIDGFVYEIEERPVGKTTFAHMTIVGIDTDYLMELPKDSALGCPVYTLPLYIGKLSKSLFDRKVASGVCSDADFGRIQFRRPKLIARKEDNIDALLQHTTSLFTAFDFTAADPNTLTKYAYVQLISRVITEVRLPEGLTEITGRMIAGNCTTCRIGLPDTVQRIGDKTFWYSEALTNAFIIGNKLPQNLQSIGKEAFYNLQNSVLQFNDELQTIGESAFESACLEVIRLPGSLRSLRQKAFYNALLKRVYIEDGLTRIGKKAFASCNFLQYIRLPSTLKWNMLGSEAFDMCFSTVPTTFVMSNKLFKAEPSMFDMTTMELREFTNGLDDIVRTGTFANKQGMSVFVEGVEWLETDRMEFTVMNNGPDGKRGGTAIQKVVLYKGSSGVF